MLSNINLLLYNLILKMILNFNEKLYLVMLGIKSTYGIRLLVEYNIFTRSKYIRILINDLHSKNYIKLRPNYF